MLTLAIAKGRIQEEAADLFRKAGYTTDAWSKESRKLIHEVPEDNLRVMIVRATDVPVYVERGAADAGVVGRDTVLEQDAELYEPLDLNIGKCRLSVAASDEDALNRTPLRVASKYAHLAEQFFSERGRQVELIKLYGSIEIAPLTGLADCVVDLVSTGGTLRENGLKEVEVIREIATILVVNKTSLKTKSDEVKNLIARLDKVVNGVAA